MAETSQISMKRQKKARKYTKLLIASNKEQMKENLSIYRTNKNTCISNKLKDLKKSLHSDYSGKMKKDN